MANRTTIGHTDNIEGFAWNSFSQTGKIGYYLLYRALNDFTAKEELNSYGVNNKRNNNPNS